jgi:dipeptidyl aminopeptidase/acylaminoacyl peptidase
MRRSSRRHVLAAATAGALLALAAPVAATPQRPGRIAYEILTGGIGTIRPDGTGNRRILRNANWPQFSRNGRHLAYARRFGNGGLWTARPDGSHQQRILSQRSHPVAGQRDYQTWTPAWAPGGDRVVFAALLEVGRGESPREVWKVCTVTVRGAHLRVLHRGNEPAWSPDGSRIAFVRQARGDRNAIMTTSPAGGALTTLVRPTRNLRQHLRYAPDGRRLLWVESSSTGAFHSRIRVLDVASRRVRTVPAARTGVVTDAAWRPDGRRIAYLHDKPVPNGTRTPPTRIFTIRPDGSGKRHLLTLPFDADLGTWAEGITWQPR